MNKITWKIIKNMNKIMNKIMNKMMNKTFNNLIIIKFLTLNKIIMSNIKIQSMEYIHY